MQIPSRVLAFFGTSPLLTLFIKLEETPACCANLTRPSGPLISIHLSINSRFTVIKSNLALVLTICKHFLALVMDSVSSKANRIGLMQDSRFFSINLARLRREKGWSQTALADFAEVSAHTVFRAESKGIIPRGENIAKLATALGVTESALFANPNSQNEEIPPESAESKESLIGRIMIRLPTLDQDQLNSILRIAEGYSSRPIGSVNKKNVNS